MQHTLKFAWIRAMKRPIRTLLSILELALGAFVVAVALSVVHARYASQVTSDAFKVVAGKENSSTYSLFESKDLPELQKLSPAVESMSIYEDVWDANLLDHQGKRFKIQGVFAVSPSYPQIERVQMLKGTFPRPDSQELLIAQSVAQTLFGSEDPIGKTVKLSSQWNPNSKPRQVKVVGVMRDDASASFQTPFFLLPAASKRAPAQTSGIAMAVVVKAKAGQATEAKRQLLDAIRKTYKNSPMFKSSGGALYTKALNEAIYAPPGEVDSTLVVFSFMAIIMLMVCSIGIFTIQFVDTVERTREVGLRRTLGAHKGQVVQERLMESVLLSVSGGILGLGAAILTIPVLQQNFSGWNGLFARGIEFSPLVAAGVLLAVVLVGLLAGLYPALAAVRLSPTQAFKEA
ncbi:ABC transporter permease [Deinococcus cellulosilyticus]|uniref:ABC transporter permease n=1 Tax=Deinococcus cellulosilyticus (strain DSM 18568 / NBRC 106333 / KACC 11606 / 5516J-15) TaxID=1223518 RepID=A0A511MXG3_DEIC1|nr:FtsX-like permease family protein [Deinococcus cellulosilyticus]GEM45285.1 hypothetical protein DC3_09200 [Deinococcus cellulosilyticus NBRC 106333 = KACC 11606]